MQDAELHLLRIVRLRILKLLMVKQTIEISVLPRVLISLQLLHIYEDSERSDAPERDQKVEEEW